MKQGNVMKKIAGHKNKPRRSLCISSSAGFVYFDHHPHLCFGLCGERKRKCCADIQFAGDGNRAAMRLHDQFTDR
jgi:hypothetical protein